MIFDVLGLDPRHYLREEIGVPNLLDGKFESWGLLSDYMFSRDEWVLRGQVFFYRKAGRKLLCSVYLAFITESGCGEGVNIFRYRCHNISFTRPLFISCMCVCPRRVY